MTRFRGASIRSAFALGLCVVATAWTAAQQASGQVARLAEQAPVKAALASARSTEAETIAEQIRFCEVAAMPFIQEKVARGRASAEDASFVDLGLRNVRVDRAGNVLGDRPGRLGSRPHLVVAAHLDTVFPEGTDVRVEWREWRDASRPRHRRRLSRPRGARCDRAPDARRQTASNAGNDHVCRERRRRRPRGFEWNEGALRRIHEKSNRSVSSRSMGAGLTLRRDRGREPPVSHDLPGPRRPQLRRVRRAANPGADAAP